MAQRCPVCKAPLWTDPLFTPGQLSCPRCGATFRPTVPWGYLRLLLLIVVILVLAAIVFLSQTNLWIILFLIAVTVFFWSLPRFIDLQRISGDLRIPEGPVDTEELKIRLKDQDSDEHSGDLDEARRRRHLIYILVAVTLLLFLIATLGGGS